MTVIPKLRQLDAAREDPFAVSPYLLEWLAGGRPNNQLPISSVCNCHCNFCSNDLNPFPIKRGTFRDIEDIKLQLSAMPAHDQPIRLSDSLPGRISEGEALLHPRLFEILELVRTRFFASTVCFTTNGCLLTEAFLKKLARYRPIEFTISMHSTNPKLWAEIFTKNEAAAATAIAAPLLMRRYGMHFDATMVPLPRVCGWEDIERTYEYLVSTGAGGVNLYWPGHSCQTPESIREMLACPLEEFTAFAQRMKARFTIPVSSFPDMVSPLDVPVQTIIAQTLKGNPKNRGGPYQHVVWLASRAAVDRIQRMVIEAGANSTANRHEVVAADNLTYRGNIIAAGLLMTDDLVKAGQSALERWPDADLFLVPSGALDSLHRDLHGKPAYTMSERLGRPVWLVQKDGVLDPQLNFRLQALQKPLDQDLELAMNALAAAGVDDFTMENALDRFAAFPVPIPPGAADRGRLREWLSTGRQRIVGTAPVFRSITNLDPIHAMCMETWLLTDEQRPMNRWTRLVKKRDRWLIESIEEGSAD